MPPQAKVASQLSLGFTHVFCAVFPNRFGIVPLPRLLDGLLIGFSCGGAILFSAKAVVAKMTYLYGVDALTVMGFRMMFSLPLFALIALDQARRARAGQISRLNGRDVWQILLLGFIGYYLSSYLDFIGLQYITAGLERLILFLAPTFVLLISAFYLKRRISTAQWFAMGLSYLGVLLAFIHDLSFCRLECLARRWIRIGIGHCLCHLPHLFRRSIEEGRPYPSGGVRNERVRRLHHHPLLSGQGMVGPYSTRPRVLALHCACGIQHRLADLYDHVVHCTNRRTHDIAARYGGARLGSLSCLVVARRGYHGIAIGWHCIRARGHAGAEQTEAGEVRGSYAAGAASNANDAAARSANAVPTPLYTVISSKLERPA